MKLLLDENLSSCLVDGLAPLYPELRHVRQFGLESRDDLTVWEFARREGYTIVSKDSDFRQRSFLFGFPPKVIWVRVANCSTQQIEDLLRRRYREVKEFCDDPTHAFLLLS